MKRGDLTPLTQREQEVIRLVAQGHGDESLCAQMNVALNTIRVHKKQIFAKLQVHTTLELAVWYYQKYWTPKEKEEA